MEEQAIPPATPGPVTGATPRLLCVIGSGRCGSTLLDILLGTHPQVQSTGELTKLSGHPNQLAQTCSCGTDVTQCRFWTGVRGRLGGVDALSALAGDRPAEGTRGLLVDLLGGPLRRPSLRRRAARLTELVRAISRESGKSMVVDSSKSLGRAYAYSFAPPSQLDVRFVHMVRDGRAFLWSKRARPDGEGIGKRPPDRSPLRLAALWATTNTLAGWVFSGRRYFCLRYEDLTERPTETLARLGRFLDVDLTGVIREVDSGRPFAAGHVVGGNRLRFSRQLTLRPDSEWERSLPARERRIFWRVAGWSARRYGYVRTSAPTRSPATNPAMLGPPGGA